MNTFNVRRQATWILVQLVAHRTAKLWRLSMVACFMHLLIAETCKTSITERTVKPLLRLLWSSSFGIQYSGTRNHHSRSLVGGISLRSWNSAGPWLVEPFRLDKTRAA